MILNFLKSTASMEIPTVHAAAIAAIFQYGKGQFPATPIKKINRKR